ncbi:MAG: hypothetical protein JXA07_07520 [Spirochaetes bacterium]|nr:hypothetical protein [Spirochaetota bacterium]
MNSINKVTTYLKIAIHLSVLAMAGIILFYKFHAGYPGCLAFFDDDFFYYLKIAENISLHGFSSFNNIHATNGYNPLWMIFLVPLHKVSCGSGTAQMVLISAVIFISMILIYLLARDIFSRFIGGTLLPSLYASFIVYLSIIISWGGMEVHLTILFALALIRCLMRYEDELDDPKRAMMLGFLSSLLLLSRLDAFILVLCILLFVMPRSCSTLSAYMKRLFFFGAGGLLLPAYFASNMVLFNTFMPISGMAKQLKNTISFGTGYVNTILLYLKVNIYGRSYMLTTLALTLLAIAGIILRYRQIKELPSQMLLLSCIAFPFLSGIVQSLVSDFPIWPWYLYPWIISFVASLIVLHNLTKRVNLLRTIGYGAFIGTCLLIFYSYIVTRHISESSPENNGMYVEAVKISEFFKNDNTSIIGIGDRAGIASYLLKNPVIQLEGLVMDREYLRHIENQDNLIKVLKKYEVSYYIIHRIERDSSRCYRVIEPVQGGTVSKKMKGVLCYAPEHEFTVHNVKTCIFRISN